MLLTKN